MFGSLTVKGALEELLARKVGLVPKDYVHWVIRDRVVAEARAVYAA